MECVVIFLAANVLLLAVLIRVVLDYFNSTKTFGRNTVFCTHKYIYNKQTLCCMVFSLLTHYIDVSVLNPIEQTYTNLDKS